jgi:hypothetical protein
MIRKPARTIPYLYLLLALAVIGLVFAAWQAGKPPVEPDWQSPMIAVETTEPTTTPTPGWWEQTSPRPIVPTMPGRQAQFTPTPTE